MIKRYKTAVYCRLSREDGNEESQSIQSQKEILVEYVHNQDWKLYDIYIDDGYSGTNFDRPSFKRLINDVELGRINIVITKDLSRLGRNYIQTGYYTEEYFPSYGVRYIALNDNFDTDKEDSNDFAPFKNIINEWYAKDISNKIRFTLDNKAKNGEPKNTVFPLFGYAYNENFERIPDPETAPIIKMIFDKYLELNSTVKVAKLLEEKKIKKPSYYNAIKYNYNKAQVLSRPEEEHYKWGRDVIQDILKNYEYTGAYVTAKSKSPSFKVKKRVKNNINCFIFEGRYEPLIDKETFEKVQKILKCGRSSQVPIEINIFKGIARCYDCGMPLRFESRYSPRYKTDIKRYYCYQKDCKCCNTVKIEMLEKLVKTELTKLKDIILTKRVKFLSLVNSYDNSGKEIAFDNTFELEKYQKRNKELDKFIKILFEQGTNGRIPKSTYDSMMEKYVKEKRFIDEQIIQLINLENNYKSTNSCLDKAHEMIKILNEMTEEDILKPNFIRTLINFIKIKTTKKEDNIYNYSFVIRYARLDEAINEFLENE